MLSWRTLRLCAKFIRHANCEASGFLRLSFLYHEPEHSFLPFAINQLYNINTCIHIIEINLTGALTEYHVTTVNSLTDIIADSDCCREVFRNSLLQFDQATCRIGKKGIIVVVSVDTTSIVFIICNSADAYRDREHCRRTARYGIADICSTCGYACDYAC